MIASFMRAFVVVILLCSVACTSDASKYDAKAHSYLEALAANQTNVRFLQSVADLPPSIREKLGAIADAGEPFSKGDGGWHPHRRFLVATKSGRTYNVAIEAGGYSYTWYDVQFDVDDSGKITHEEWLSEPAVSKEVK